MTQTAIFDADADGNSIESQLTPPTFTSNIWKGTWRNATAHRRLTAIVVANQPFATDGVIIEQSISASPSADSDAHIYSSSNTGATISTNPITGQTYYSVALSVERVGWYARLVVKHAGTEPTTFIARMIGAGIT